MTWQIFPKYLKKEYDCLAPIWPPTALTWSWPTDKAVRCLSLLLAPYINVTKIWSFCRSSQLKYASRHVGFLDPLNINPTCVPSLKREALWAEDPFGISFSLFQSSCLLMASLLLLEVWAYFASGFLIWELDFVVFLSGSGSEWCQWHATTLIPPGLFLICLLLAALPMLRLTGLQWGTMRSPVGREVVEAMGLGNCLVGGGAALSVECLPRRPPRLCLVVLNFVLNHSLDIWFGHCIAACVIVLFVHILWMIVFVYVANIQR